MTKKIHDLLLEKGLEDAETREIDDIILEAIRLGCPLSEDDIAIGMIYTILAVESLNGK